MKRLFTYTMNVVLAVFCGMNVKAATDSLPPCISNSLQIEPRIVTQYDYKGQRLFSYKTSAQTKPNNNSDQMSTIRFYDYNCRLVFTWIKGGVAGLNKTMPDSIQKEKIITIRVDTLDTIVVRKTQSTPVLPDTIAKLALKKNSGWIEESSYKGNYYYRFETPASNSTSQKTTFGGPYYNEKAIIVTPAKSSMIAWWHIRNGKFSRTPFRPGYR
jgi:hypothetical protein